MDGETEEVKRRVVAAMQQLEMLKDRVLAEPPEAHQDEPARYRQAPTSDHALNSAAVPRQKTEAADDALVRYANTDGNSLQLNENLVSGEYPEKLAKLQKKVGQFEAYLEEKDRTILEQETQLSDLQDQLHEALKQEDALRAQLAHKAAKADDLAREAKALREQHEKQVQSLQQRVEAKDQSLGDAWQLASDREVELSKAAAQLQDATDALKEHRAKTQGLHEQAQADRLQCEEAVQEAEQIKGDFLQLLNFKNELEVLIEEQTHHLEQKNKKFAHLEETLRFKDAELEKKDSLLRRVTAASDEMKRKLSQAEMKLRQVTQTTLRDNKAKLKDQQNEIEVLKEMVKSATTQAKAKDIDIQRLHKKMQRLEKLTEMSRGMPLPAAASQDDSALYQAIPEENEQLEETGTPGTSYIPPLQQRARQNIPLRGGNNNDLLLGLNPLNYAHLEDEVHNELLQAQHNRQFNLSSVNHTSKQQ